MNSETPGPYEDSPRKETLQPKITLWRAITGRYIDGVGVFSGVPDPGKEGIFTSNYSQAQYYSGGAMVMDQTITIAGVDLTMNRSVAGLPVFFNRSEAVWWLKDKVFKSPPIIAQLELPMSMVQGEDSTIKIVKNAPFSYDEQELGEREFQEISRGKTLRGEAYIAAKQGFMIDHQLVRSYETLHIMPLKEDGTIVEEVEN